MSNEYDPNADLRTTATSPVRMVSTDQKDALRYGKRQWVINPENPSERRLMRSPAHAHADVEAKEFHPRAKTWYEPVIKVDGNLVNWAMTSGSADIPTGQRHETHVQWVMNSEWLYQSAAIRTRICFDEQIKRGLLNPEYVLQELVVGEPCSPSCCPEDGSEGYAPWDGTPKCPKTRIERESRLKRHAERYGQAERAAADADMKKDLDVAKAANTHAASTIGPAIASGVAEAMKALLVEMRPDKAKK